MEVNELRSLPTTKCNADTLSKINGEKLSQIFLNKKIQIEWKNDVSKISSLKIPDMAGGVNSGDRRALYFLVRMLKPASILEIGTHIGSSTIALALSALKNRREGVNTKIISTDIIDVNDQVNKPWEVFGAPVSPADLLNQIGCENIVSFEIGNSIDKLSLPRKFGIIFLDGDHRASTVYKEIPFALKCLEDGGVIILHDYFPNLEPLWKNQMPIAGPFLAIQRFIDEGIGLNIIPFGELPWSTKFGSNLTSLAILAKS
jgi:predicted O-methyltransferase YrrM